MNAYSKRSIDLQGIVTCPGDKSISQRSVIIGSLLDEDIQISGKKKVYNDRLVPQLT